MRKMKLVLLMSLLCIVLCACNQKEGIRCTFTSDSEICNGHDFRVPSDDKKDWETHTTYFSDDTGNSMTIYWTSPAGIGDKYLIMGGSYLAITDEAQQYQLVISPIDFATYTDYPQYSVSMWTGLSAPYTYPENGAFNKEMKDGVMEIVYEVEMDTHKGYTYFVIDRNRDVFYKISYCEQNEIYDESRVLEVIDSITY